MSGKTIGIVVVVIIVLVGIGLLIWYLVDQNNTNVEKGLPTGESLSSAPAKAKTKGGAAAKELSWIQSRDPFDAFIETMPAEQTLSDEAYTQRLKDLETAVVQFKGADWEALPRHRAVYFEETTTTTGGAANILTGANTLQQFGSVNQTSAFVDPIFSTLPYQPDMMTTLPTEPNIRGSWLTQYQLMEQILALFRIRRQIDQAILARLNQLMWLLYNEQRRIALIFTNRWGRDMAERYYMLMIRYLRLLLIALLIRERREEMALMRTRAEIDAIVFEIEGLMLANGGSTLGWQRGRLGQFTDLLWAPQGFGAMPIWVRSVEGKSAPPHEAIEGVIASWVAVGATQSVAHPPIPVATRGGEAAITPVEPATARSVEEKAAAAVTPMESA